MKTKFLGYAMILTILLAACAPAAASTTSSYNSPIVASPVDTAAPAAATTNQSPAAATTVQVSSGNTVAVEITNFTFEQNTVTIKIGDTITWTNHDSATHTVVADDGSFRSGSLSKDASFSFTFNTAGTFPYKCGVHASMVGTVIVQP
jgi:plastocyanin